VLEEARRDFPNLTGDSLQKKALDIWAEKLYTTGNTPKNGMSSLQNIAYRFSELT
jgi:hypothetical protein